MRKCLAAVCLLMAVANPLQNGTKPQIVKSSTESVKETFDRISKPFDKDIREIGHAIAKAESDFRNICNNDGCKYGIGPMQIVRSTFKEQCDGDVFNTEDNIMCGFLMIERGHYWRWRQSVDKWFPQLSQKAQKRILP